MIEKVVSHVTLFIVQQGPVATARYLTGSLVWNIVSTAAIALLVFAKKDKGNG